MTHKEKTYFCYGKYQMRPADYQLMIESQESKCSICKKKMSKDQRLFIDHDHSLQEKGISGVRGLLCNNCNLLLGHAKDSIEILEAAIKYLKEGGDSSRFYVEGGRLISSL